MKALSKLQSSIIVQAAQVDAVAEAMSSRAREFIAVGALVALTVAAGQAKADEGPMSPSACASVGAVVGGAAGATRKGDTQRTIFAAIGALGGAAVGHWMCNPRPLPSQDSSYNKAASYGGGSSSYRHVDVPVAPGKAKAPLSFTERDRLDSLSQAAMDAKYNWKKALYNVGQAERSAVAMTREAALAVESEARHAFERQRDVFATTVARMNRGSDGVAPRAVGRYLELSAALLELDTGSRVSYQELAARDERLKERSEPYRTETERAAFLRNRG